jgi:uncharacterized membrane protein YozB (DUF420 family)
VDDVLQSGFLGTNAPWTADATLLLELALGVGLLVGAMLARAGHYRLHAVCQSVIVLLNLAVIVLAMFPAFHHQVLPKLPGRLGRPFYAIATAHGALGIVAEIAGLYVLVAAGTKLLPEKLRITRFRFWMRSVLVLWWVVLLLGCATYVRWYVPRCGESASAW